MRLRVASPGAEACVSFLHFSTRRSICCCRRGASAAARRGRISVPRCLAAEPCHDAAAASAALPGGPRRPVRLRGSAAQRRSTLGVQRVARHRAEHDGADGRGIGRRRAVAFRAHDDVAPTGAARVQPDGTAGAGERNRRAALLRPMRSMPTTVDEARHRTTTGATLRTGVLSLGVAPRAYTARCPGKERGRLKGEMAA